jgi:hypothetical protein
MHVVIVVPDVTGYEVTCVTPQSVKQELWGEQDCYCLTYGAQLLK